MLNSAYIWRLRIPFSNVDSSRNYLSKVIRYDTFLEAENSLSNLPEFVSATLDCFEKQLPFETYNLTNPGIVTPSELVSLIQESGITDRELRFFKSDEEFMRLAAKTPRSNCVLDCQKALNARLKLVPIRESIRRSLKKWEPEAGEARSEKREARGERRETGKECYQRVARSRKISSVEIATVSGQNPHGGRPDEFACSWLVH